MIFKEKKSYIYFFIFGIVFLCIPIINNVSYVLGSILLLCEAILSFFLISKREENYASLCALFSLVWFGTIGLANLKIMDYQRVWSIKTWFIYGCAYVIICFCIKISSDIRWSKLEKKARCLDIYNTNIKNMFIISTCLFFMSVLGFGYTAKICGFIPFFATDSLDAYSDFYTKFLLLSHFAIVNIPLSYIILKKTNSKWLKIFLCLYIIIQVFLIPILSVNRGIFMIGALMLTIVIFFMEKKKIRILLLCIIASFVGYEVGSIGRNYTNEMLKNSFKQSEKSDIEESDNLKDNSTLDESADSKDNSLVDDSQDKVDKNENGDYFERNGNIVIVKNSNDSLSDIPYVIPEKFLFLYSYLTVSHDNLDLAIKYNEDMRYGSAQFNSLRFITKRIIGDNQQNYSLYRVQSNLTTYNLLGTSYYDFGIIGVILFCIIFGLLCGCVESVYKFTESKSSLLVLSVISYCVILSFFSNYTSQFIFVLNLFSISMVLLFFKILDTIEAKMKK